MDRLLYAKLTQQNKGVLTLAEVQRAEISPATAARNARSGLWTRLFEGVYLTSAVPPTFEQKIIGVQKWAGDQAAFCGETAAYLQGFTHAPPAVIDVVVPRAAALRTSDRVRVHRPRRTPIIGGKPLQTVVEQTVVDLINTSESEEAALDFLIRGVQKQMNIRLFEKIVGQRQRQRHRDLVTAVLASTGQGMESHMELFYHQKVEAPHGLPRSVRQKWEKIRGRWIRSDCIYEGYFVRSELDGELAHPGRATDDDVLRDNDVRLARDEITLRYRWKHVRFAPCLVAAQVGAALGRRGWNGELIPCGPQCDALPQLAHLAR